jgi:hypothetical protein
MRIPIGLTLIAAVVALAVVVAAGQALLQPDRSLIGDAGFSLDRLTPNADGQDDVAEFHYALSRNATVSVILEDENGQTYAFRNSEPRAAGEFHVLFSGVVDGFSLPDDTFEGDIERRLLPDGAYTWRLTATGEDGETAEKTGTLTVADGDVALPILESFTVSPPVFTPNQDGVADRVAINVTQSKDATLSVYLIGEDGTQYFIPERQNDVLEGKAGRHSFDYEGGVDENADPPPDGTYTVYAKVQDAVGQRTTRTSKLTIQDGGHPLAQIVGQPSGADVVFVRRPWDDGYLQGGLVSVPDEPGDLNLMAITMPVGDLLVFRLTVENYSRVPIRTFGPEPGTVYPAFDERAATMGYYESSGAWRVGIDCDNATSDYPWRWAIGAPDVLTPMTDPQSGDTFYYLMPGQRSIVWGAVRMTDLVEISNPQACWAGLIHEDVEVTNARVGARDVELAPVDTTPEATPES